MFHTPSTASAPRTLRRLAAGSVFAAALAGTASAQTAAPAEPASTQWGLGLAAGVFQRPYRDVDDKRRLLPLLYAENAWLRVAGATADAKLGTWSVGTTSLSLTGRLKYEASSGYEADDAPALAGLDERKASFWAGGTVAWHTPIARASLEWTGDASGHSKGQQLQLQVDRRFGFGALSLTPRAGVQWLDKKYVDYYYGVKDSEARPGRAAYTGKAATALSAGLRLDYQLQPKQSVFLDLGVTRLPDEIKRSPIAGRSSVSHASVGYLYRF